METVWWLLTRAVQLAVVLALVIGYERFRRGPK